MIENFGNFFPKNVNALMVNDLNMKKKKENVIEEYYNILGFKKKLVHSRQIHSDIVKISSNHGFIGDCDGIISNNKNHILAIQVADCLPIFIVNLRENIISLVHSGWRGSFKKILLKTVISIEKKFNVKKKDFLFFFGPSIHQCCYEVGFDVSSKFQSKHSIKKNDNYMLNLLSVNIDQLLSININKNQISFDKSCTMCSIKKFHSFRRDGEFSGRNICYLSIN